MKNKLLFVVAAFLLGSGCATFKGVATLDNAKLTAYSATEWSKSVHEYTLTMYNRGDDYEKAWFRKHINPKVNDLVQCSIVLDELVGIWDKTRIKPYNLDDTFNRMNELYKTIMGLIKKGVS